MSKYNDSRPKVKGVSKRNNKTSTKKSSENKAKFLQNKTQSRKSAKTAELRAKLSKKQQESELAKAQSYLAEILAQQKITWSDQSIKLNTRKVAKIVDNLNIDSDNFAQLKNNRTNALTSLWLLIMTISALLIENGAISVGSGPKINPDFEIDDHDIESVTSDVLKTLSQSTKIDTDDDLGGIKDDFINNSKLTDSSKKRFFQSSFISKAIQTAFISKMSRKVGRLSALNMLADIIVGAPIVSAKKTKTQRSTAKKTSAEEASNAIKTMRQKIEKIPTERELNELSDTLERLLKKNTKGDPADEDAEVFLQTTRRNYLLVDFIKAAKLNDPSTIKKILKDGKLDPNTVTPNSEETCALHVAAENGHVEIVKLLLEDERVMIHAQTKSGRTGLYIAAQHGHTEIVKLFLENKYIDPNRVANNRLTPIYIAAKKNHTEIVKLLIENKKTIPNIPSTKGVIALHLASQKGNIEIVRLLLKNKSMDPDYTTDRGATAFTLAASHNHAEIVKLFLENDRINPNMQDKNGGSALYFAARKGHVEIVRLLHENLKINPNLKDQEGKTAFHIAASEGHTEIVELLLKNKRVAHNLKTKNGSTALDIATKAGHTEIVKLLKNRELKADIVTTNKKKPSSSLSKKTSEKNFGKSELESVLIKSLNTTDEQAANLTSNVEKFVKKKLDNQGQNQTLQQDSNPDPILINTIVALLCVVITASYMKYKQQRSGKDSKQKNADTERLENEIGRLEEEVKTLKQESKRNETKHNKANQKLRKKLEGKNSDLQKAATKERRSEKKLKELERSLKEAKEKLSTTEKELEISKKHSTELKQNKQNLRNLMREGVGINFDEEGESEQNKKANRDAAVKFLKELSKKDLISLFNAVPRKADMEKIMEGKLPQNLAEDLADTIQHVSHPETMKRFKIGSAKAEALIDVLKPKEEKEGSGR